LILRYAVLEKMFLEGGRVQETEYGDVSINAFMEPIH